MFYLNPPSVTAGGSKTYLPGSKAGDAMGDSSRLKKSMPSVARFGFGETSSHDTCPRTLQKEDPIFKIKS